jgi:hypothetical protein
MYRRETDQWRGSSQAGVGQGRLTAPQKQTFRFCPTPVGQAGDQRSRKQLLVKRDLSRFSVSDVAFRERAIRNRLWDGSPQSPDIGYDVGI